MIVSVFDEASTRWRNREFSSISICRRLSASSLINNARMHEQSDRRTRLRIQTRVRCYREKMMYTKPEIVLNSRSILVSEIIYTHARLSIGQGRLHDQTDSLSKNFSV